jgi:glyoxylase-like metal-dependent hydrolase (beta-lactamase superfamily II)
MQQPPAVRSRGSVPYGKGGWPIKIGKLEVHLLSDGVFKLDGGALFGPVPKILWSRLVKADTKNRVRLGMNCVLVRSPEGNILVDTGAGNKHDDRARENFGLGTSKLARNLRDVGVSPKEINSVVLSHLHFDHAGGGTKANRKGAIIPTFPKAEYVIQKTAWEHGTEPDERGRASYRQEDFLPLLEKEKVRFIDGDHELAPGVSLKMTGGHSRGHQVVLINGGGAKVAFLGDLVPTPYHLALPYISALDQYPEETLEKKRELLNVAEREGWLLLFSHGYEHRAGYLERRDGRISLRPVEV